MAATRVGIVGGGVAGCSLARTLSLLSKGSGTPAIKTTLFEMGRGLGGRTATRRSSDSKLEGLAINHGAPAFDALSKEFKNMISEMEATGHVAPWKDMITGSFDANSGKLTMPTSSPTMFYRGAPAMSSLCEGLINGLEDEQFKCRFRTMVKDFKFSDKTKAGTAKISASTIGWQLSTFSAYIYFYTGDKGLSATLDEIGQLRGDPVFVVMQDVLIYAFAESILNFRLLRRTHGRGGTAEAMGARSDSKDEKSVIGTLLSSFEKVCSSIGVEAPKGRACYGPALHRWGAAFPANIPSPTSSKPFRIHAQARLIFAGDFLAIPGGRIETSYLSGAGAAEDLLAYYNS
eukprot:jgi/Bigna1/125399/aug1.1_g107